MMSKIRMCILGAAVALIACGPSKPTGNNTNTTPPDQNAPEFEGGGQEANIGEDVYPGPYGVGVGSVIHNYQFYGYPRAFHDPDGDGVKEQTSPDSMGELKLIQMSDFYNPTGDEVFPEGSPYGAGVPKPRALVVDRSAVWCGPCNKEAAQDIPERRKLTAPLGEFLVVLDETNTPGLESGPGDIEYWASRYKLDYPGAIDPAQRLDAIIGVSAYPGNVIVRTRDMKIITWTAGTPDAAFWQTFQEVIEDKPVLPGD